MGNAIVYVLGIIVLLLIGAAFGSFLVSAGVPSVKPKARTAHIVFDLETLGTVPGSVVATIGAHVVYPHRKGLNRWGPAFYVRVDHEDAKKHGLFTMAKTLEWWDKQSAVARDEVFGPDKVRLTLPNALAQLRSFVGNFGPDVQVWGNGSDFDCAMLACAYDAIGQETPWLFWNTRCLRSFRAMHSDVTVERDPRFAPHHAQYDATYQAEILLALADKGVVG